MKISAKSGATLAAAAASLLIVGAVTAPANAAAEGKGHCMGVNECKGKSACGTAANACAGKNECKGKGFLEMTKADCDKAGGKFEEAKAMNDDKGSKAN
jgi:hypothetical protein